MKQVSNQFPNTHSSHYRLAVVGGAPGKQEAEQGLPFIGGAGQMLTNLLQSSGVDLSTCFLGNICQFWPANNDLSKFTWTGFEIQSGLQQLRVDLNEYKPNLVLLLGKEALRAAMGLVVNKLGKAVPPSLDDWRGSVFICDQQDSPLYGFKCLATYHPAVILRAYDYLPYFRFDLRRAGREAKTPVFTLRQFRFDIAPSAATIVSRLAKLRARRVPVSIDIEGGVRQGVSCIGVAYNTTDAFIIPFQHKDGSSYWPTAEDEGAVWSALAGFLQDPGVPKILQNALYDTFVLAWSHSILVRNVAEDTMLKHWELYCEMEKGLGVQTSLYTDIPYYKAERTNNNDTGTYYNYCLKDCVATMEISQKQEPLIRADHSRYDHYRFNINILRPFLYIELLGMRLDKQKLDLRVVELRNLAYVDPDKDICCGFEQLKLQEMAGRELNVNSSKQMCDWLYNDLKLPVQFGLRGNPTADFNTLLTLGLNHENPALIQAIKVRRILKRTSMLLSLTTDSDGRIRSSLNPVGTNTGRVSSSGSATGNGTNLQTIPKPDRDLFTADMGYYFNQNDLSGADGWTVAAWCAALGDSTMLDDYNFGIKPAKVIALMVLHGASYVQQMDRVELKAACKTIDSENDAANNYIYFISKCCQHGSNYGMKEALLAQTVFTQSDGEIRTTPAETKAIQEMYFKRYKGVRKGQEEINRKLVRDGFLVAASGTKRTFFGRKEDVLVRNAAYSFEPQANTTYATNLALARLWEDPLNRRSDNSLIIQPIHQVHDALCTQFPIKDKEWAIERIKSYFKNPLVIAGLPITIPFSGGIGTDWADVEHNPI